MYKTLDSLMSKHDKDISFDEYQLCLPEEHKDLGIILEKLDVSEAILTDLLQAIKEKSTAHNVALLAIDVAEGRKSYQELIDLIGKPTEVATIDDDEFVTDDLELLYENRVRKHGLRWRLNTLNRMLGSLRKGNFGFVFARPETGKTTFLTSEVSFFAEQLSEDDGPILWFNNEEDGEKVQLRIYHGALGISSQDLYRDVIGNRALYRERTKQKIKLIDRASITRSQVERMCSALQPSLIIFDQIDKIKGFDGDREDLRLGAIYQWAREIAKTYCPVIGVTQADGSGEGKKWLTMENVANAKTAKQAEADWILGIGATHQEGFDYVRHLHLSKNKLDGDEDTDPSLRHGKQDVLIQPEIARYQDYT